MDKKLGREAVKKALVTGPRTWLEMYGGIAEPGYEIKFSPEKLK